MTPNIAKSHKDTSKFFDSAPQKNVTDSIANMDGDHSAKTMDQGANAASNAVDSTDGLHEDAKKTVCPLPFANYSQLTSLAGHGNQGDRLGDKYILQRWSRRLCIYSSRCLGRHCAGHW